MASFSALPDNLDITIVQGDEFSLLLDFGQDLTGYTFEVKLYEVLTITGGMVTSKEEVLDFGVTEVDLSLGIINISLNEAQTAVILPGTNYSWLLRWVSGGGVTRTIITGKFSTRAV